MAPTAAAAAAEMAPIPSSGDGFEPGPAGVSKSDCWLGGGEAVVGGGVYATLFGATGVSVAAG